MPLAEAIHRVFSRYEGSEQIASLWALQGLYRWLFDQRPERVLEVGSGIGTISMLLARSVSLWASWSPEWIVSVEDDTWCCQQWRENIWGLPPFMHLFDKVPLYETFNLVIVDGPQMPDDGWSILACGGSAFFEGGRRHQRAALRAYLRNARRSFIEIGSKPPDHSKGFWIISAEPTLGQRLWAPLWNGRERCHDLLARLHGVPVGKRRRP